MFGQNFKGQPVWFLKCHVFFEPYRLHHHVLHRQKHLNLTQSHCATEPTVRVVPQEPKKPKRVTLVSYPGSPFELFQPYPPAGDQPTAIAQLVEGVNDGEVFQTLLGVTGSGKTFTMANVIAQLGRPAIIFAPNKTLAAQLYSEFREFFPNNAVEYFVSYYDYYQPEAYVPQRDLFIEKDSAINEHIEQMRLSCTKSILERRDVIVVATGVGHLRYR